MLLTRRQINAIERAVVQVFISTMGWGARQATVYINDHLVVRATRRYKPSKRDRRCECVLTYGNPNFVERRYIRLMKPKGPLPKSPVVKWWPSKKK